MRSGGRFKTVRCSNTVTVGTLASFDLVANQSWLQASTMEYRALSFEYYASWSNINQAFEGPLMFGIAFGDYTSAEIEEWLEGNSSLDIGDKIKQEQSNRWIRRLGQINNLGVATNGNAIYNDGKKSKVRLNWLIPIGITLSAWVYNAGAVQIADLSVFLLNGDLNIKLQ